MSKDELSYSKSWSQDLISGLVVFLVALPLCLGIAMASGAPLFSGIIAGIVGGIVVGFFSGSAIGVSGPAAGLATIVAAGIKDLGYETFLLAVVFAGVVQIVAGMVRAGIIGHYFPNSVIKGMLAGIGVIIFLKQIPHALGYDKSYEGELAFDQADGANTFTEIIHAIQANSTGAIIITVISLIILIFWNSSFIQQKKALKLVPAPLLVVLLGIGLNQLFAVVRPEWVLANINGNSHLVSLPVANTFDEFTSFFTFPNFSELGNHKVYFTGFTIAVVASIETLLSVEASDKLDIYKRVTPTNRELKAQGIGNILSGFLGGIPVTQVIVRTSANAISGGRTKLSAIFHGIFLSLCVALIPVTLNMIPLASLAAVLLMIGYKLANPSLFKKMFKQGISQFIPFIVTIVGLVFTDILIGIGVGMAIAFFVILINNYKVPYYYHVEEHAEGDIFTIQLAQEVSFLNKASILVMLENLPENSEVTIDGTKSVIIDQDIKEVIQDFVAHIDLKGIKLKVRGISGLDIPEEMIERNVEVVKNDKRLILPSLRKGKGRA